MRSDDEDDEDNEDDAGPWCEMNRENGPNHFFLQIGSQINMY